MVVPSTSEEISQPIELSTKIPGDEGYVAPSILGEVSEVEYNDFVDKNKVTDERLNDIAGKVKNQQPLSEKETAIFHGKTSEINDIIAKGEQSNPEIQRLETEKQEKIAEASKPKIKPQMDWIDAALFSNVKNKKGELDTVLGDEFKEKQKEIRKKYSLLKVLIDCS